MRLDFPKVAGDGTTPPADSGTHHHPRPQTEHGPRASRDAAPTRQRARPHRRPPAVTVLRRRPTDNTRFTAPHPVATAAGGGRYSGLLALTVLQVWVWGASAIPKLTSLRFVQGFGGFVGTPTPGRPAIYQQLVVGGALAAPAFFAWASLLLETALALAFVGVSVLIVRSRGFLSRGTRRIAVTASLLSAGFALNLALLVGDPAPWSLQNPFDSGVSLEYLIAGMALAGLAVVWQAGRAEHAMTLPSAAQRAHALVSSAASRPDRGDAEYRREPD
jgi:hypothetical protein